MATVNVAGSYEAASLGTSYVDDYVMHADSEVVFWEETGAAYTVEMNITGQGGSSSVVELDVAADSNPFALVVNDAKDYSFRFKAAAGTVDIHMIAN